MNRTRGFTIIELLITITVMAILMTLAVVNLRSTQINARDAERKSDVEAMAKRLDSLYSSGFPTAAASLKGSYPSTVQMADVTTRSAIFRDIPAAALVEPLKESSTESVFVATNTNTGTDLSDAVTSVQPIPNIDAPYIYQPLDDNGALCTNHTAPCRKFNLYTWIEGDTSQAIRVESRYR